MRIANNVMAMNTHRQYTINNNNVAKSAEKLSSGYRVNRAGDDAAGLAISEKMRAQIRGLNMAGKNSQDGNSLIQTAEGALQEIHSILQRMNELSVQSATGTNQTLDRNALNAEYQQLSAEIGDISSQTTFNDTNILDGTFRGHYEANKTIFDANIGFAEAAMGTTSGGAKITQLAAIRSGEKDYFKASITGTGNDRKLKIERSENSDMSSSEIFADGIDLSEVITGYEDFTKTFAMGESFILDLTTYGLGSYEVKSIGKAPTPPATENSGDLAAADIFNGIISIFNGKSGSETFMKLEEGTGFDPLKIQVGAKEAEQMKVGIAKVTAETLGLKGRAIDNQKDAGRAITLTRSAINQVSTIRGALGAAQNRLDHKIANLNNSVENLAAAESRIRDVDMASEMTQFTKANVLSQASTAMLAQANSLPQNVLSLLR